MMVSTVPVMIPLMVRRSASTATTLYSSLKNPVSLHPISILMRNLGTVFPPTLSTSYTDSILLYGAVVKARGHNPVLACLDQTDSAQYH